MARGSNKVVYFCRKIKADKHGFHETMWLDEPCKGWKVLKTAPVQTTQSGLIYDYRNGAVGRHCYMH